MNLIRLTLNIYGFAVVVFGLFRTVLYFLQHQEVVNDRVSTTWDVLSAFIWGMRYDILIIGFIFLFAYILLIIYDFTSKIFLKNGLTNTNRQIYR